MGVPFEISLYSHDEPSANAAAQAAFARVKQLNALLSDYDPDSELSRLCRNSGPGRPVAVGPELRHLIGRSLDLSKQSGGAFDISVGPIVEMWRKARRKKTLPDPQALADALRLVGYQSIRVDMSAGTVELLKEGMRLDLGAIAKGYAADEALAVLKQHGMTQALVAAAGDIVVGDPPPGRKGWRIGIASLERPEDPPKRFVSLKNAAVSTSGDAYQFIEMGGKRYSHIVDPKTGLGLTRRMSATVIASEGIASDSLATTACLLGPERGLQLLETIPNAAAIFVEPNDAADSATEVKSEKERLRIFETRNFAGYVDRE
jgi:thiamine biosynthesis lipoprotein